MKILILDGSPHPNGTTSLLRKAFAEGALSAGHTVDTFHTAKEDLHPCLAVTTAGIPGMAASTRTVWKI